MAIEELCQSITVLVCSYNNHRHFLGIFSGCGKNTLFPSLNVALNDVLVLNNQVTIEVLHDGKSTHLGLESFQQAFSLVIVQLGATEANDLFEDFQLLESVK